MRRIGMMVVALGALAAPLAAQGDPQCVSGNANVQDACNTAVDAVKTFHPLAGMIVSGGNPVLGTARTLGGLGHLSLTARVNAVKVAIPNPDTSSAAAVSGGVPAASCLWTRSARPRCCRPRRSRT